jgi:uncharacterized protein (TIGR03382 family)
VNAIPIGHDWPLAPFVMQGVGGPAVYVMDETNTPSSSNGGPSVPNNNQSGCNASGEPARGLGGSLVLALAVLAIARRKRK